MAPDDSTPTSSMSKKPRHRAGKNQRPRLPSLQQAPVQTKSSHHKSSGNNKQRGRDSSDGNDNKSRKGGFRVGPKLGKGQYTGHLKKTKQTLIHKAKVKRQYQKDLVEAGYAPSSSSTRGGRSGGSSSGGGGDGKQSTGSNASVLGKRKHRDVIDAGDDDANDLEKTEQEKEDERERLRRRLYGDDDGHATSDDESLEEEDDDDEGRGRAFSRMQRATIGTGDSDEDDDDDGDEDGDQGQETTVAALPPPPTRRPGQRLPQPKPAKLAPNENQQQQKPRRPRLTPEQIEELRREREKERKFYAQRTARGQPKLGSRVEHLLSKIQKSMGK
ncbi:hypothetical protein ACM66B_000023 [Microbotryomycetes sp. NB124-2]